MIRSGGKACQINAGGDSRDSTVTSNLAARPGRAVVAGSRRGWVGACPGDTLSPKIGDMIPRKKLSTTIGANNYAYLQSMVKAGRVESMGEAVDKALEMARRLDNRARLECQTAAYFEGLTVRAAAEEAVLEDALSGASQEMDFDQP